MRRLQLVGVIGAAVAVLWLAACGSSGPVTISGDTPPVEMLEAANLDGIDSGVLEATFETRNPGTENGYVMHMTVGVDRRGKGSVPPFFVTMGSLGRRDGQRFEFNGRLFYSTTAATLVYGPAFKEETYALRGSEFEKFKAKLETAQAEGGRGDASRCLDAAGSVSLASLIEDPRYVGSVASPVEGPRLFRVSGQIDVAAVVRLLVKLAETPECGAQLNALHVPAPTAIKALGAALASRGEAGRVVLGIDKHGLLRSVEATLDLKRQSGESIELKLLFSLREINQPVDVPASAPGKPLAVLLKKFGVSSGAALRASGDELLIGLLEGFGGGATGRLP